jgi:hypothetical protein
MCLHLWFCVLGRQLFKVLHNSMSAIGTHIAWQQAAFRPSSWNPLVEPAGSSQIPCVELVVRMIKGLIIRLPLELFMCSVLPLARNGA